jgi:hypothetical protein
MPEEKEYAREIYDYLGTLDKTYQKDVSFDSFKSSMVNGKYSSDIYSWISSKDPSFAKDVSTDDFYSSINVKKKDQAIPTGSETSAPTAEIGFPTSPLEALKATTRSESISPKISKAPKGIFEIKKLPSEKPEFVDRLNQNAELQNKLLNDPTFTLLSGSEDKIVKANIVKNKAIASQRGQTMDQFKSDQDEYLAGFLDDRQKQEFSGFRGRLELLNQIKKAKASGQPSDQLVKIYDEKVKKYSEAKAQQVYEVDNRIKELRIGLDEAPPEDRSQILDEIQLLESSKKPFFINTKKEAAAIVEQEGLKGSMSDKEKVREYSHALLRERSDLRESLGIKGNLGFMDALNLNTTTGSSGGDAMARRLQEVEGKLKSIAPVVLLDETPITEKEGSLSVLGKEFAGSFAPGLKNVFPTNQSTALNVIDGLELSGVSNKSITEDALSTLEKTSKPYENWSAKDFAQMTGSTLAFLPKFVVATVATEGLGSLSVLSPYWRSVVALAEEGTIGAEASSPLLVAMQSNKYGRGLLKTAFSGIESGVQSEVESRLFSADKDEMNFLTGVVGNSFGKVFGYGIDASGKAFSRFVSSFFGSSAPEAANKFLSLAKLAYTKTKEVNYRAIGEVGEEAGEQLSQLWQQSENGQDFLNKVSEQYGNPSNALRFFLSTYMMGFGLSSGTYLGKWNSKKAADSYNSLSPTDRAIADDIVSELRQEQNGADTDAAVNTIRDSDLSDDKKSKLEQEALDHGAAINKVIEGDADTSSLKPFESKDLSDSPEKQKEQADIDKRVEAFQERTKYKPEELKIEGQVKNTIDRLSSGAPVDIVAVEEASNALYAKYKQYENMLDATSRYMTTDQIKGLMSELEGYITKLENVKNGKDFNSEVATSDAALESATDTEVDTVVEATKPYQESVSSRDVEQGFAEDTVEGFLGSQYYADIIASAKAEGLTAAQVIKDLYKNNAFDNLETREDIDAIEVQLKRELAGKAAPEVSREVTEPIDEFIEANYTQIVADLKLNNKIKTKGCAY